MKKLLALVLVLALMLSLAACTKRPESPEQPAEPDKTVDTLPDANESENKPAETPEVSEPTEPQQPAEPSEKPEDTEPTPSAQPEESPEPSEEPEESPEPSEEPEEPSVNEGKVDSSATVSSTATDLAPADASFLALIPELPFEGWASTNVDGSSVLLELNDLPADVQTKLMEYIQDLRDEGFDVTEYTYGSLYEASVDGVTVTIMLEGGKLSVIIEKK